MRTNFNCPVSTSFQIEKHYDINRASNWRMLVHIMLLLFFFKKVYLKKFHQQIQIYQNGKIKVRLFFSECLITQAFLKKVKKFKEVKKQKQRQKVAKKEILVIKKRETNCIERINKD